ncbi:PAS domain-containing protein [Rhodobacter capsulatus]|uniref:PAS domain-containing protein n=1 Tax=Rhodobacter capsulatus TaxID=1061 RepID=UPI004025B876
MAEIETRLRALEAALAQQAATPSEAAQAELRAALDRLRVSCAEQAAALELALHHPAEQVHLPGELLRRLPVPVLRLTHGLRVLDANAAARALLGDGGTGERSGVLRAVLSRSQARALTQALDAAFLPPDAASRAPRWRCGCGSGARTGRGTAFTPMSSPRPTRPRPNGRAGGWSCCRSKPAPLRAIPNCCGF